MSKAKPLSIKIVCIFNYTAMDTQNISHVSRTLYGLSYLIINTPILLLPFFTNEEIGSEKLSDLPNFLNCRASSPI